MGSRPSSFALTGPGPIRLFSTAELLSLPAPQWLIEPIMPAGGLVGLYGQPGSKKSFLAIDIAMSVATGTPWQEFSAQKGYVVYVSAEGGTGIGKRVNAWLQSHRLTPQDTQIAWLVESIPIHADSEQVAILLNRIVDEIRITPSLVVVDTLARCFDGDENQQEDMGRFIAGVDTLRRELGSTVLVVHHTRLGGDRERGNTAFRGAADTMIAVRTDTDITVSCSKQKDDEEFADITLQLQKVDGTDSCVIQRTDSKRERDYNSISSAIWQFLEGSDPLTWDEWLAGTGLARGTFHRHFTDLKETGQIAKKNGKWGVVGQFHVPERK